MPEPVIDKPKCTGCGTCVEICPMTVFEMEGEGKEKKAKVKNPSACVGCRACEVQCPEECIKVND